MSNICTVGSSLFSWLRGTRYAVRGTRYAVSNICKSGSSLFSWLRGTRYAVSNVCEGGS